MLHQSPVLLEASRGQEKTLVGRALWLAVGSLEVSRFDLHRVLSPFLHPDDRQHLGDPQWRLMNGSHGLGWSLRISWYHTGIPLARLTGPQLLALIERLAWMSSLVADGLSLDNGDLLIHVEDGGGSVELIRRGVVD